jgi:hypothetical protein
MLFAIEADIEIGALDATADQIAKAFNNASRASR